MVIVIKTLETPKNIKAKGSSSDYIKSRVINGDKKNELKRWFTPRDTLQTIDMIGCIVTGFMKKMPEYAETITNLQIVPYLNQATQKNTCQKKTPKSKISNPKKSFDQPCQLKSGVPARGRT